MVITDFFQNTLNKSYVINLKDSLYRYNHVRYEFSKFNISNYQIIEGINNKDKKVLNKYKNNKIVSFPPCFRCGYNICNHPNNIITPSQVANFLSFKKIMKKISNSKSGLYAIFEDDFYFKENINRAFSRINRLIKIKKINDIKLPVLIRIGSHTTSTKKENFLYKYLKFTSVLEGKLNMANPCFVINKEFANLFLNNLDFINVTSDTYIHKILCENNKVLNYSIKPFPIGQHSHGSEENYFSSQIVEGSQPYEKLLRVNSENEYIKLLDYWF